MQWAEADQMAALRLDVHSAKHKLKIPTIVWSEMVRCFAYLLRFELRR
jgi:hypothetical protein